MMSQDQNDRPVERDGQCLEMRGWLIETARNEYWDGRQIGDDANFVHDANEGCRFARFEDAEVVRCWLLEKIQRPQRLRSTENVFLNRAERPVPRDQSSGPASST